MRFEWDAAKNAVNLEKHGVSFEEGSKLFSSGRDYLEIFDAAHSEDEERFIAIGPIARGLVLVISTEREHDVIRIISARWASRGEQQLYIAHKEGRRT